MKRQTLLKNVPNPFNLSTTITYSVPSPGVVEVTIYDILGRQRQSLVNAFQAAGTYSVDFDVSREEKKANGIYYYTLRVGEDEVETRKMVSLR